MEVGKDGVAQRDQPCDPARLDLGCDIVAAQRDALNAALRPGDLRVERGGGVVCQGTGGTVDQCPAGLGQYDEFAVGARELLDAHLVGDLVERIVALILKFADRKIEQQVLRDLEVELLNELDLGIDVVDRLFDVAVDLEPEGLDPVADILQLRDQILRLVDDLAALRDALRRGGERLEGGGKFGDSGTGGGVGLQRAEQILQPAVKFVAHPGVAEQGSGAPQVLQHEVVDFARDAGNLDTRALARNVHRAQVNDLARIPFGIHIGDVLRRDLHRLRIGLQGGDGVEQGYVERHRMVSSGGRPAPHSRRSRARERVSPPGLTRPPTSVPSFP